MSTEPNYTLFSGEDDDGIVIHPVLARMLIEAPLDVDVDNDWTDDGCLCVELSIKYPDQTYYVEWSWINPSALLSLGKTINNLQESIKFAGEFTKE